LQEIKLLSFFGLKNFSEIPQIQELISRTLANLDEISRDHSERVAALSCEFNKANNLTNLEELEIAARLHDIGKSSFREEILAKLNLSPKEKAAFQMHSVVGAKIVEIIGLPEKISKIVRSIHENRDSSGYPDGLRAEQIPLEAQIIQIVDAFDAMTNDRGYNHVKTQDEALTELRAKSQENFDPELVKLFCSFVEKNRKLIQAVC